MKKFPLLLAAAVAAFAVSSAAARPMTAVDLQSMHRLGAPAVSPDGRWAAFTVTSTDWAKNKRVNMLHMLDLTRAGAQPQLMAGAELGHDPMFTADGSLWFLMAVGDQDQLFRKAPGQAPIQASRFNGDLGGFEISDNGNMVVVWADRPDWCQTLECKGPSDPEQVGSGRTYNQLFVRHWDTWAEPTTRSRLFAFPVAGGQLQGPGKRITGQLVGDTPSKPFGSGEEIAISADGRTVYFALREAGRIESTSTNLDIFSVPTDGSVAPVNLTDANDATDNLPTLSPDGRKLAYVAMARPTYESDRQVLMVRDLASGAVRPLTQGFDRSVGSIEWAPDGRSLYITAEDTLEQPVFRVDASTGAVKRLITDGHAGNVHALRDGSLLMSLNSIFAPDDLYRLDPRGRVIKLTGLNDQLLGQLDRVDFRKFSFKGANNDTVWGWTLKPVMNKTLPIALLVHGGPQGTFSNSWSYRWNPRLFTAPGYAAVSVDFHGSTGYGQAFTDAVARNWGGWPLEDLQKGLAFATANDPQLQADKACALGGSYGGYMMNWIEGRWPDRFKCLVQHDGIFDARGMAYETEELWFDEWEHGGKPYYEAPQEYERWNPVNYVTSWKTPQLVITSENDFRVPYTQGLGAFTALQRRNIPSRLLVFPDENHWVLKPKNSVQWYREVFGWMRKWLGEGAPVPEPVPNATVAGDRAERG